MAEVRAFLDGSHPLGFRLADLDAAAANAVRTELFRVIPRDRAAVA